MSEFVRSNRCYHGRRHCPQCGVAKVSFRQLPCIVCNKELEPAMDGLDTNQPYSATTFIAQGQYGSTVFDPFDGSYLEVNICDVCLAKAAEDKKVLVGYLEQKSVHKPLKYWTTGNRYDD